MLTPKLRWWSALLISALLLLWRLLDFLDEARHHDYHISRVGLSVFGGKAEWLQLLLILACLGGVLLSLARLWWLRRPTQSPANEPEKMCLASQRDSDIV
ncbi:hypothetical protein [Pseudaeromonas paramecii]|uniref:Uncharacterized protein n=1 Tax=Pseudaeromonas paramecii TaxID=2138166 RepID=A0ABP8PYP3_9GAMM